MSRRISVNYLDRLYASLNYLLPITAVLKFGASLFAQFPVLIIIFFPIFKVNQILSIPIIDIISVRLIIWLCVFIFVVRNYKVNHFVRFNAMQALLLDIFVSLVRVIAELLVVILGQLTVLGFVLQIIYSVTFLCITAAFVYTVFQCVRGEYANKIPVVSDVVARIS
jgi:uncharacterized membrane protein